jgi:kynurenine formamidase
MLNNCKRFELWELFRENIEPRSFVDLTHTFHAGQPHFSAFPDEESKLLFDFPLGHGFQVHHYSHVGQWGTHVDPPVHFIEGGRALDELPVKEMILPLVVLDISAKVAASPDAVPGLDDVAAWESKYGTIRPNSFVALRTDWHKRWPDAEAMGNKDADGVLHSPGWSKDVLELLFEERGITAVGHEQTDTDPGMAISKQDYSLEYYVLARDRWQIELMANLDKVPEAGALIVAAWPRPKGGSGYPVRVFAIY